MVDRSIRGREVGVLPQCILGQTLLFDIAVVLGDDSGYLGGWLAVLLGGAPPCGIAYRPRVRPHGRDAKAHVTHVHHSLAEEVVYLDHLDELAVLADLVMDEQRSTRQLWTESWLTLGQYYCI